jgi:hypothetical protein
LTAGAKGIESGWTFTVWAKLGTDKRTRKKIVKIYLCIKHLSSKKVKSSEYRV